MDKKLTIRETAGILGVSSATIQNWKRSGLLPDLTERSVSDFLNNRNRDERLTSRANKRYSRRLFSPSEYGGTGLNKILPLVHDQGWSLEEALFHAFEDLTGVYGEKPQNPWFDREMNAWESELFPGGRERKTRPHFPPRISGMDDFPGWLYQALLQEGEKSVRGSYYTPPPLVEDILNNILSQNGNETFFDPCCGTGGFICPAAKILGDPERVYGQDADSLAVRLSRLNLMRLFPGRSFEPSVYRGDSLAGFHERLREEPFSAVATNPPWGFRFSSDKKKELSRRYPLSSGESASLFLLASLKVLKREGKAGFVLPESLLHRKRHEDIRRLILENTESIHWYGHQFSRVQSECFALFLRGSKEKNGTISIGGTGESYARERTSFAETPMNIWNVFTTPDENGIFRKLFRREHMPLGEGARWGLGIVTGDNRERLNGKGEGSPVLRGPDLSPFSVKTPVLFLDYGDSRIQQKAPLALYRESKIVYRFIARRPIAALDNSGSLTLNSVNFFLPGENIDPELAVMLLNSRLYGLYFEKTFHTLKVLRGQLEFLPFPLLNDKEKGKLKELYPLLQTDFIGHRAALDNIVYDIFQLTTEEKKYLEENL